MVAPREAQGAGIVVRAIAGAVLVVALAGCSAGQQQGADRSAVSAASVGLALPAASTVATPAPAASVTVPAADAAAVLTRYHWRLTAATDATGRRIDALMVRPDRPLQLDFDKQGVAIGNTCNRLRGRYSIAGGKLTIGNLASTLMACHDPALTALDAAAYLQGTFTLDLDTRGAKPELTLATAGGERLAFTGAATAATRYGGTGETVFLEIAPQDKPCPAPVDAGSQCLDVRELHYDAQGLREGEPGPWHVLAQAIGGYSHAAGTRNVLRVKRYRIANPPAGAASTAYVLDMVVESEMPPHSR